MPKDKNKDGQEEQGSEETPPVKDGDGQENKDDKSGKESGDGKDSGKSPLAGFADLSQEEGAEDPDLDDEGGEGSEKPAENKDDKPDGDPGTKDKKDEKPKGDEEDSFEFKVPEKGKGGEGEEGTEETWKGVGKDLDLEVEGDNFSDLKSAYDKKIKAIEKNTRDTVLQEIKDDPTIVLKDVDQKTRDLIKVANSGADLAEYLDPIGKINTWLALDNEKLVRENYKAMKDGEKQLYNDERIDEKVTKLIEDGQLADKADTVREELVEAKATVKEEYIEAQQQSQVTASKDRTDAITKQTTNFHAAVDSIDEFMDGKVGEDLKTFIKKEWNEGKVHDLFKDPQKIAEYYLYHLVGDQALEKSNGVAHSTGRELAQGKLHNVPPATGSGGANRQEPAPTGEKGFGAWEKVTEEMAGG